MSKTVDILIDKKTSAPEIKKKIVDAKVQKGDTLKFSANEITAVLVFTVFTILYLVFTANKKLQRRKEGEEALNSLLDPNKTREQLEQEIADEYGINIAFELLNDKKTSILDAAFGIWEGSDITIDQIREKAWPKRA